MRPDLFDHLAPWSRPERAGWMSFALVAVLVAASVVRLAATAPIGP